MGRGDRYTDEPSAPIAGSLDDKRTDAHVWVDRVFDAVTGLMQGAAEIVRGASDVATGRRPTRGPAFTTAPSARAARVSAQPSVAELGEWYVDDMLDAETGRPVFVVTNGTKIVECRSREMANEVIAALNAQGVRTRADRDARQDRGAGNERAGRTR